MSTVDWRGGGGGQGKLDQAEQGWIGYAGTHVPMFVHKRGLINGVQT